MENKITVINENYISEINGEEMYGATIIFPDEIREGERFIRFKKPLSLRCYHIGSEDYGHTCATFDYDFGMTHTVPLEKEHNFILMRSDGKTDEEKIALDVIFDLFHAFFHTEFDPNYTDYHWALYGNLKDRVEFGEYDKENKGVNNDKNLHDE